ncbi:SDR family oxidoreductase [Nisaea acidiphila]|uniref:SDR family oxidoreductase n=1 Tax=Nisaea acidiphila TaxID=1862145 RepID=A0A9J7ASS3_9PROT|nr:SDR family oxidoreductase [Nisaea acidiphila]UUX50723.1 SDR family oxidoreductase [Nisaea acidiphila]
MTKLNGTTALVTGANRGIGKAFVEALIEAGASRIYAGARKPETLDALVAAHGDRVVPVTLDVTRPEQVRTAAEELTDISVLINNAGIARFEGLVAPGDSEAARAEMETNYFGLLNMVQAFAPVLKANGGGAIVNLASIVSHFSFPGAGSYSASKAAVHSLTQGIRGELRAQGTLVVGVYPGPIDTDMGAAIEMEKTPPSEVAKAVLAAVDAGTEDVYPDLMSQEMHRSYWADPKAFELHLTGTSSAA